MKKLATLPAGVHYTLEDNGVLPNGGSDGGMEMPMAANMATYM